MDQRGLIEQARQGEHDAFAALIDVRLARLDAAARLIVRDPELARDAVQDGLIRAWRDLRGLRDPDRFDAWLHRLIVNACLDQTAAASDESSRWSSAHRHAGRADLAGDLADRQLIDDALGRLDPGHRAVVALHYLLGLPLPEVASALGIPLGTAKSRLHYAIAAMRTTVAADSEPVPASRGRTARMTAPRRFERDLPALIADLYLAGTPDYRDELIGQRPQRSDRPGSPRKVAPHGSRDRTGSSPRVPWRALGEHRAHRPPDRGRGGRIRRGSRPPLPAPFGVAANGRLAYNADGDVFIRRPGHRRRRPPS